MSRRLMLSSGAAEETTIEYPADLKRSLQISCSFDNYTITWGGGGSKGVDTYWNIEKTVYSRASGHPIPIPDGAVTVEKIVSDKPVEFRLFGGMWDSNTNKFTTYNAIIDTGFVSDISNLVVSRISHFILLARVNSEYPAFTDENRPTTVKIYFSYQIPIGVNLFDPSTAMVGYWSNTGYIEDSNYRRFILPFDSGATFTQSNIFMGTGGKLKLADENGIIRWTSIGMFSDIPASLKTIALEYEQNNPGIKLVSLYANCRANAISSVVWMRTS